MNGPDGEPRELDLRYEEITARQRARVKEVLKWGTPSIAGVALLASLVHVGAVVAAPIVALVHLVLARVFLAGGTRHYLSPSRRLFLRWITRFLFLWIGIPGYAAMAAPIIGIAAGVATFLTLTGIVYVYTAWSFERERARQPLLLWEKAALVGLVCVTLVALAALILCGAVIGWSVSALLDAMPSG